MSESGKLSGATLNLSEIATILTLGQGLIINSNRRITHLIIRNFDLRCASICQKETDRKIEPIKRSKSEPIKVVTGPQNAGIKSRIPEARASLKKLVSDNTSNQSYARRLSFKTQDIPLDRIPLPKHWLKKVLVIDDVIEIYFHNTQRNG